MLFPRLCTFGYDCLCFKVRVGDNCTTDWISIPCATTSTDGSVVQFPGKNPGIAFTYQIFYAKNILKEYAEKYSLQ